jgi:hypothetical protein
MKKLVICAVYTEYISLTESNLQNIKACFRNRWAAFLQVHFIDQWCTPTRNFVKARFTVIKKCTVYNFYPNGVDKFFSIYFKVNYPLLTAMNWEVYTRTSRIFYCMF